MTPVTTPIRRPDPRIWLDYLNDRAEERELTLEEARWREQLEAEIEKEGV